MHIQKKKHDKKTLYIDYITVKLVVEPETKTATKSPWVLPQKKKEKPYFWETKAIPKHTYVKLLITTSKMTIEGGSFISKCGGA